MCVYIYIYIYTHTQIYIYIISFFNTNNYEVFKVLSKLYGMLLGDFVSFFNEVYLCASFQETKMYKDISINQIASEFFPFQKLPVSGDSVVPGSIGFPGDLSGRSSGSWVRTGPAKTQG